MAALKETRAWDLAISPAKEPSRASVHALHVQRGRADIQHGNRPHVALHAVQEHCGDECRCVAVLVRLHHANIPAQCLLHVI